MIPCKQKSREMCTYFIVKKRWISYIVSYYYSTGISWLKANLLKPITTINHFKLSAILNHVKKSLIIFKFKCLLKILHLVKIVNLNFMIVSK